jgi:two-component system NtrC family sensor kinase
VIEGGPDERPQPAELVLSDGRHIEVSAGFVRAHDDQPAGRFLVLRDRTDQRRSEGMLRQRQKLESLGILAAGVAHEVNNPLAFVRANLVHLQQLAGELQDRLKHDGQGPAGDLDEIPEVVDESLVGLDRIGRIVDGLLRLSRAPTEALGRVDLNTVVAEAVRYAALHRNRQVTVKTDLAEGLPGAEASADRLIQVILNLLLNAKQALAERDSGTVCVETGLGDDGRSVEIRVRDDGPGIPEELQDRIFDPFFTTRGPGEGTGLGLSIAYDIVRELGGMLSVNSRAGDGACFVIRLPLSSKARDTTAS